MGLSRGGGASAAHGVDDGYRSVWQRHWFKNAVWTAMFVLLLVLLLASTNPSGARQKRPSFIDAPEDLHHHHDDRLPPATRDNGSGVVVDAQQRRQPEEEAVSEPVGVPPSTPTADDARERDVAAMMLTTTTGAAMVISDGSVDETTSSTDIPAPPPPPSDSPDENEGGGVGGDDGSSSSSSGDGAADDEGGPRGSDGGAYGDPLSAVPDDADENAGGANDAAVADGDEVTTKAPFRGRKRRRNKVVKKLSGAGGSSALLRALPMKYTLKISFVGDELATPLGDVDSGAFEVPVPKTIVTHDETGGYTGEPTVRTKAAEVVVRRSALTDVNTGAADPALTRFVADAVSGPPAEATADENGECAKRHEARGHKPVVVVLIGDPEGRTIENVLRNVVRPLCAWTILIAETCSSGVDGGGSQPSGVSLKLRVNEEPWSRVFTNDSARDAAAQEADAWLAADDLFECGRPDMPLPAFPFTYFGWTVRHVCRRDAPGQHGSMSGLVRAAVAAVEQKAGAGVLAAHIVNVTGAADFDIATVLPGRAAHFPNEVPDTIRKRMKPEDPLGNATDDGTGRLVYDNPAGLTPGAELIKGERTGAISQVALLLAARRHTAIVEPATAVVLRRTCDRWRHCHSLSLAACKRRAMRLATVSGFIQEQDAYDVGEPLKARVATSTPWLPAASSSSSSSSSSRTGNDVQPVSIPPSACAAVRTRIDAARARGKRPTAVLVSGAVRVAEHTLPASIAQLRPPEDGDASEDADPRDGDVGEGHSSEPFLFVALGIQNPADDTELESLRGVVARVPSLAALLVLQRPFMYALAVSKSDFPDFPYRGKGTNLVPDIGALGSQDFGTWSASILARIFEQRCGVSFDLTMRLRSDTVFIVPPRSPRRTPTSEFVLVDGYGDFLTGINDQFSYGPTWLMGPFFDRYFTFPVSYRWHALAHAESALLWSLEDRHFNARRLVRPTRKTAIIVKRWNPPPTFVSNKTLLGSRIVRLMFP